MRQTIRLGLLMTVSETYSQEYQGGLGSPLIQEGVWKAHLVTLKCQVDVLSLSEDLLPVATRM